MDTASQPISERFRLAAKEWVALDSAANILEEAKSAVMSQMMMVLGSTIPVSRAEMQVKASSEWREYLDKMVKAREAANLAKVKMKYVEMKFSEQQSREATARAERRL